MIDGRSALWSVNEYVTSRTNQFLLWKRLRSEASEHRQYSYSFNLEEFWKSPLAKLK